MQTKMQAESRLLNWGSAAALLLLFAVSLSVGVADFSWRNLFAMPDEWQLLLTSRLPRTFAIVLTGASMAVALLGAVLVLACDIIGRLIRYPFEIPVATVFGVLGTVLFLVLLMKRSGHAV